MIVPSRRASTHRGLSSLCRAVAAWACLILLAGARISDAQTIDTVRDNEFRSRWADYQVDRPQANGTTTTQGTADEQAGLLSAFGKSFVDVLRNGPLQTRANLAVGWEYSNEQVVVNPTSRTTDSSPFVAPGIAFFYNNLIGPATVSARYSAGYVYYLDQSYVAANHSGGIFSETAGLDIQADGVRSSVASSSSFSYGQGDDIESGTLRTQLSLVETATASYLLSTFTRVGVTGGATYATYEGGGVADTQTLDDTASVYIEYAYSPKTRGRFEVATGQELQTGNGIVDSNGSDTADRYYYQALISGDYLPSPKFNLSVGLGYGVQEDSSIIGRGRSGSHPIYRITVNYLPTPKTAAYLRFGYEGVDVAPSLEFKVNWQFRLSTSASVSIYQSNNYSTYELDQSILTRGALIEVQQRVLSRVDLSLSSGIEQSEGYGRLVTGDQPYSREPYLFAGPSLLWEINSYLALQAYYRGYTGQAGAITTQKGLRSRASVSLRLTF